MKKGDLVYRVTRRNLGNSITALTVRKKGKTYFNAGFYHGVVAQIDSPMSDDQLSGWYSSEVLAKQALEVAG